MPDVPEAAEPEGVVDNGFEKTLRLLVLGESTMAGVGVKTHEEGFAGNLARALSQKFEANIAWKVYAKSGFTAEDVRMNIVPTITETPADLIVIGLGANDAFELHTPWKWRRDVQQLIKTLQENFKETPIAFASLPPIKTFPAFTPLIQLVLGHLVHLFGETLEEMINNFENVFFHAEEMTLEKMKAHLPKDKHLQDLFSDGVHPSQLSYGIWAEEFSAFLVNEIDEDFIHS